MSEQRDIPQRELRNDVGRVLREVAAGSRVRVTVRGRPVAELIPVGDRSAFVPRSEVQSILESAPLDDRFDSDVESVAGATIDEL
jgi:prevent-host-death family protein